MVKQEDEEPVFELVNELKHHLDLRKPIGDIMDKVINNIQRENKLLANSLYNKLKTLQICLSCGQRQSRE